MRMMLSFIGASFCRDWWLWYYIGLHLKTQCPVKLLALGNNGVIHAQSFMDDLLLPAVGLFFATVSFQDQILCNKFCLNCSYHNNYFFLNNDILCILNSPWIVFLQNNWVAFEVQPSLSQLNKENFRVFKQTFMWNGDCYRAFVIFFFADFHVYVA